MSAPLSPDAWAVLNAFHASAIVDVWSGDADTVGVAAALRAVVKSCMYVDDYGFHYIDSDKILGIAAELESVRFTSPTAP